VFVDFGTTRATYETFVDESHNFDLTGPESVLRGLTADDLVLDFCASDLEDYADGDTVGSWVARRGGLTASVTGSPTYTAPDSDLGVPSVTYAASGDVHETPATIDWSAYAEATILGVHYTESVSGVSRGMNLSAGALAIGDASARGLGTYRVDGKITGLHYTDEAEANSFWYERDNVVDAPLAVTVVTHDLLAVTEADLIEVYVNGEEQEGTGQGDTTQGSAWQSDLRARLGGADATASSDGLDGRLHRFVAIPRALSADNAAQASNVLIRLAKAV
jgi:hypothetical protein